MQTRLSDTLLWRKTIDRGRYLLYGTLLIVLKLVIDWQVATRLFGRPWTPFRYVMPGELVEGILALNPSDRWFYSTMAAIALPFIWLGVGLTLQRLRSAAMPLWLVMFFFAPLPVNALFFLVLCCVDTKSASLPNAAPDSPPQSASMETMPAARRRVSPLRGVYSLAIVLPISLALVFFSVKALGQYGWGVFLGMPFVGPLITVVLAGVPGRLSIGQSINMGLLWVLGMFLMLLITAFEGVICLLMMMPIFIPLAIGGSVVGFTIQAIPTRKRDVASMCLVLGTAMPALMGAEAALQPPTPVFEAVTSIEIDAPASVVWGHVVAFGELPPPDDWLFKTGIAYPKHATIEAAGAGAIRRCVFSTGAFVEPIEIWDPPRLLRFAVTECPPPMRELNPFHQTIEPPHLQHFLVAKKGQFELSPLPDGRTRLVGTTWYQHHLWPAEYWHAWSNPIIQRIHLQVLKHIKRLSESDDHAGS